MASRDFIPIQNRLVNFEQLLNEWKIVYSLLDPDDAEHGSLVEELEFESLCIGWCLAKGLSIGDGYDFYQEMIERHLF